MLIAHGDRDDGIPIESGEQLYALIAGPKRFLRIPGAGHEGLGMRAVEAAQAFIAERID